MITIVSGLPRSGTSLMMQMLEKGGLPILTDNIRQADEDNKRGYYEYEKVKNLRQDNTWLQEADGKAVKIITQLLPYVDKEKEYFVLYMVRPLEQIINSQREMLKNLDQTGANLSSDDLAKAYSAQTNRVQNWLIANKVRCLFIFYPEVLSQPLEKAQEIENFLNIKLNIENMASAIDTTMWRQKQ